MTSSSFGDSSTDSQQFLVREESSKLDHQNEDGQDIERYIKEIVREQGYVSQNPTKKEEIASSPDSVLELFNNQPN